MARLHREVPSAYSRDCEALNLETYLEILIIIVNYGLCFFCLANVSEKLWSAIFSSSYVGATRLGDVS